MFTLKRQDGKLIPKRRDFQPRVWNTPKYPPGDTETDSGYFSVSGSSGQSESNYSSSETMSDWSKDSPLNFKDQPISESNYSSSATMSDWSKDSPPYFKDQPIREDNTTTTQTKRSSKAALKKDVLSPVEAAVFLIGVATVLYFACSVFSRETLVNQDVKIVLPSTAGEEKGAIVIEKLLNQLIKQLKQEVETRVRVEIQAEGDTRQATDNAEGSGLVSAIKFCFLVLSVLFIIAIFFPQSRLN